MKRMWTFWLQSKKTSELPLFWQAYEACFAQSPDPDTPLDEIDFVALDTETTGLNPKQAALLSIGAVRLRNRQIYVCDSLELLIRQPDRDARPQPFASGNLPFAHFLWGKNNQPPSTQAPGHKEVEIHGILSRHSEQGMDETEALEQFIRFIGKSVLVGHHLAFDLAMINRALKPLSSGRPLKNRFVDTIHLAMRVHPPAEVVRPGDYTLDQLGALYRLPLAGRHTAAGDAFITALLLMKLLDKLQKRGVTTLGALLRHRRRL